MPKFLLLLRNEGRDFSNFSPADFTQLLSQFSAWAERRRATGQKIVDDGGGRTLRKRDDQLVFDGPYCEGKEVIGGYYVLTADNEQHAMELASDCPVLEWGSIEVRTLVDDCG